VRFRQSLRLSCTISPMSRVRFRAGDVDLELSGPEPFVLRQLKLLSAHLGAVDADALGESPPPTEAVVAPVTEPAVAPESEASPAAAGHPPAEVAPAEPPAAESGFAPVRPVNGGGEKDDLLRFYANFQPQGLDRQSDAALLFAYYLQQRKGLPALQLGDLIRCCIRAGVDTRNFNRTLGILTRRGYLETVRPGQAYRLSEHGVAAVESRM
jgi:hypothetical protein